MTAPTNYSEEYAQVAAIFAANWVYGSPSTQLTPILWEGKAADIPTDINGNRVNHVRFFIMDGEADQISIGSPGSNTFRHPQIVMIKIFTVNNAGQGVLPALDLADKFCTIFRNRTADGISFKTPYMVKLGVTEDGFYQVNAFCPYDRDSNL